MNEANNLSSIKSSLNRLLLETGEKREVRVRSQANIQPGEPSIPVYIRS